VYVKATCKPVAKVRQGEHATEFAGQVYSDLWGPAPVVTLRGKCYYVSFIDDKTRLADIWFLQKKHETLQVYKDFEVKIHTQFNRPIKILHSDYGGKYKGKEFILHLKKAGTLEKLTVHDMPQHNGIAKRFNCTVVEKVCAMLHTSGLPWTLWGEAAHHAVWVINHTTTKALDGMTPFEAATGKKPDLCHVREWGEKVWVRLEKGTKLGDCVKEGHWIGIDDQSKGFRIY
jgi:hypothetical protein